MWLASCTKLRVGLSTVGSCLRKMQTHIRSRVAWGQHPAAICRSTAGLVSRPRRTVTCCGLKARWRFDIRFGRKTEATKLLQQWVREIGAVAGLQPGTVCIRSGSVGAPESRLEMEIDAANMEALDSFWAGIPAEEHRGWCSIMQDMVVDGSPVWEVYRDVPVSFGDEALETTAISKVGSRTVPNATAPSVPSDLGIPGLQIVDDKDAAEMILKANSASRSDPFFWEEDPMPSGLRTTDSGLSIVESSEDAEQVLQDDWKGERDWKGDPLRRNPGDKIPRFE